MINGRKLYFMLNGKIIINHIEEEIVQVMLEPLLDFIFVYI